MFLKTLKACQISLGVSEKLSSSQIGHTFYIDTLSRAGGREMRKGLSAFPCPCHPKLIKIYIVRSPRFEVQIAGGDDCNSGVAAWKCVLFFVLMTLDHMKTEDTCRCLRMPDLPEMEKLLFLKGNTSYMHGWMHTILFCHFSSCRSSWTPSSFGSLTTFCKNETWIKDIGMGSEV